MTRAELEAWAARNGWERDTYGHYHKDGQRLKFQDRSVRLERSVHTPDGDYSKGKKLWLKRKSAFFSKLSLDAADQIVWPAK